uniref:WG repeat-containing protein n=1 Tax=Alistipes shahii TaxID=328814 RepID=UPI003FF05754
MRPYILLISLALSSCAASQCPQLYMNRTQGSAPCYFTDEYGHAVFGNARYENARQFIGDRAAVRLNGKWGFIDPSGATAVPLQYDWCGSFGEYGFDKSVAMVKNEVDKFKVPILSDCPTALIDRKGNRVTPFYGFIFPVRDKVAFVNDGRTDFADTRLQNLGFADGKWGCVDPKGRLVVPCVYELAYLLIATPGFTIVRRDGKWGVLNDRGRPIVPCVYDAVYYKEGHTRHRHAGRHVRSRKERRGSERRFPGKTALHAERGRNRDFHRERPTGARSINAAANK